MSFKPIYQYPLKPVSWNERELLIFAASIGCNANDLQHGYELDPDFSAFPTYPIVLTFKHDYTSTSSFVEHFTKYLTPPKNVIPGFPTLDIQRVVDGERSLEVVKPLPKSSEGRKFIIMSKIVGIWDKGVGKSTIVKTEHDLVEQVTQHRDVLYTRMSETAIFMGQGGWNGPNERVATGQRYSPPSRNSDARSLHHIAPNAHLLYRLNGDYNPLHATHVSEAVVQPTPIMHGLYSWNVVAKIVLETFANGGLKSLRASFASPVRPGDVLEVEMWEAETKKRTEIEVRFVAKVKGRVVLANGIAVLVGQGDRATESKL